MARDVSTRIGANGSGNVIVSGDGNQVRASVSGRFGDTVLPAPEAVNIRAELEAIRAILAGLNNEHATKISRALDDADEEAAKPKPDNNEVGSALRRALGYARQASSFTEAVEKLAPHVKGAVGWLGSNWHSLLPIIGISA